MTATPRTMTTREIEEASSEDREFVELRQCIKNGNWKLKVSSTNSIYLYAVSALCDWKVDPSRYQDCHTKQVEASSTHPGP